MTRARLFRRSAPASSIRTDGLGGRWQNEVTGRGGPFDRHASTTFAPPVPLDATTIDALSEFHALGRRIIWREPSDALRPGFRLEADGLDPAAERRVYRWLRRRFDLVSTCKRARAFARATGGAAVILVTDDAGRLDEPLDLSTLRRVHRLIVRDRFEIWPDSQIDLDPRSAYYGHARHYVTRTGSSVSRIHRSRLVVFDGFDVSDRSRERRQGWGGSVFDLIWAELRNWSSSNEDAAEAITLLTQGVFKIKGAAKTIAAGNGDALARRFSALRLGLGTLGDLVLDKEDEDYITSGRSFAGLGELLDRLLGAVIAATDMPEVVLRGNRSAGLNGGSEGDDLRAWYDLVGSERADHFEQQLLDLLAILLAEPGGPTDGIVPVDLGIDWPPMWSPTEAQAADNRAKRATARAADIAAGVVDASEARTDADLGEYYELADGPAPHAPPARSLEPDEDGPTPSSIVVEDEAAIPPGEVPISATEAARRLGYASPAPILRLARDGRIRVWRAGPGSPYRVLQSEVSRAMLSIVAPPEPVALPEA